jgi:PAT family beta-lactamase induction signal transducer AmpG
MQKKLIYNLLYAFSVGISSGLVYAFLVTSSVAYMQEFGVSLVIIGFFSIKMLPYSCKYFFAPYIDHYKLNFFPPSFCMRKSWMLLMQMFLIVDIAGFGFIDIQQHIYFALALLTIIALLGAVYDIALQAYIIELFSAKDLSLGDSALIYGFRLGMVFSGVIALLLAATLQWKFVFMWTALGITPCMFFVYLAPDVKIQRKKIKILDYRRWFFDYFVEPLLLFWRKKHFLMLVMIVTFYKVSDAYLDTMLIPFFLKRGFSKEEIALAAKTVGMIGTILGVFIGGAVFLRRWNIAFILFFAECLAALTNLQFIIFMYIENNFYILAAANFLESFSYGISNVVLMTFIGRLCDKRFTATHFALLSSISAFGRVLLSPSSGVIAENLGWNVFFIVSAALSVPALICIMFYFNKNKFKTL